MTIDKMKIKTLSLFALSIFALIFLMSAVSAVDLNPITVYTIPQNINQNTGSFNIIFDLKNVGVAGNLNFSASTINTGSLSFNDTTIAASATETIKATVTFSTSFSGTISGVINVTGTGMSTYETLPFSVQILEEAPQEILDCSENPGKLEVKNIDFNNDGFSRREFGSDDEWFFLDEIEVEIEVENDGNWDVDDISLEWGIYDLGKRDWVIDLDEEDEFNLKDGDEETIIINFKLDDDLDLDFDEIEGDYRFYVIATGTIDDNDAGSDDGKDTCAFDFDDAEAIIESDFVVLDNIDIPETLSCGETVTITADVWNTGDSDQDEVSIEVFGRENILDFRKTIEVGDIDEFDRQQISFTFTVPKNIDEKFYALNFEVNDEDRDVYENDFDDDLSEFTVPFKVEGNCGAAEDVIISASLESEARAGKEMVIRATIINNGDELKTFTINAAEFLTWADAVSQDQNTLVLNAGQSRDVLFKFDVKKDTSGSQTFFIELVSDDDVTTRQPVSVNIEASRPFLGITGFAVENASLWGLGLLNIILVVIIIIVAVRIARRK
jgi:hypothetical protein